MLMALAFSSQANSAMQNLSPVAREAYDRYGCLDEVRVQLLVRGHFLSQEEADTLPLYNIVDGSSHEASRVVTPRAPSANEQSNRVPWTKEETELLMNLHVQGASFPEIAEHVPGKSPMACQRRFYYTMRKPDWKQFHDSLRQQYDQQKKQS
ncbi:hypothetical protein VMCG_06076 [Cytospora schulzeri]|uniref:Myb-like domain-containing protein n=1 Tax=Cytospora schulzeri TaxID=448051 RepID=A0A423WG82_9PEZI|nr:hypothetical protein VMCG_06076 [Valsa malicola]